MVQNPAQPSSGQWLFQPAFSDLVLESLSRIQIRGNAIQASHMFDARMSANLMLQEWGVRNSVNLWEITLQSTPLYQGVSTYNVGKNVVALLDPYIRQYQVGQAVNITPAFSTTATSTTIGCLWSQHGLQPQDWFNIVVPIAVGGTVLFGLYQTVTVPNANNFTFVALDPALSSVTAGGVTPLFTTTTNSTSVLVTVPNHGLVPQQNFMVQLPVLVGDLTIYGQYTVTSVVDANNFTITSPTPAAAAGSVYENGGLAQMAPQLLNAQPEDRVIFPISRSEYAAQPNKLTQAYPTTYWWDRSPAQGSSFTLWPVPDQNGPYVMYWYAMTQIQDVSVANGQTLDLPNRFLEAFAAGLAAKLAWKYPPPVQNGITVAMIEQRAQQAWDWAAQQDVELGVPLYLSPGLSGYFR